MFIERERFVTSTKSQIPKKISGVNWNQVYYFSLVANYGSIKAAAETLGLSPSTLSEHVSQLEQQLKVELFHRRGPKLILTEQGNRLFAHAKGMFEHSQRLLDAVSPLQLGNYPISVGFVPGPHLPLAYRFVGSYRQEFGPLSMKLHHSSPDLFENCLLSGKYDFGFSDRAPDRPDLDSALVAQSPIRFYVSAQWKDQTLAELLRKIPLLVCRSEASTNAFIERALQENDLEPTSVVTSDFPSVLVDFCMQGLGVGTFCEEPILKMNAQSLRSLRNPKDAPSIESSLYVIWSKHAESTQSVGHLQQLVAMHGQRFKKNN